MPRREDAADQANIEVCAEWLDKYTDRWWQQEHHPRNRLHRILDAEVALKASQLPGAKDIVSAGLQQCSVIRWGSNRRAVYLFEATAGIECIVAPGFLPEPRTAEGEFTFARGK